MRKRQAIFVFFLFALTACGGGGGEKEATRSDLLAVIAPKTAVLASLPPAPNPQVANASISGLDSNTNGVRDDLEIVLAKTVLHDGGAATSAEFGKLLDIVKSIQPTETSKTIDIKKFYCDYQGLPVSIKDRLSGGTITALVTDTPARRRAFAEQSRNAVGSLGAEVCE